MIEHTQAYDLFQLHDKAALVIGGGQGMGEQTALRLAQLGCHVAVADLEPSRAERVAHAIAAVGTRAAALTGNVLHEDDVRQMVKQAKRALKRLDLLVCTVGQATFNPLLDLSIHQWEHDLKKNLRPFLIAAQELATTLVAQHQPGSMVCITSVNGLQSSPNHAPYGVAKAGLINLVRSMAVEWAPYGIRVNALAPGSIITPRIPDTPERRTRTQNGLIPFKRCGTSDEVAKATIFLLSDLASYVTGHTLCVDGGWMAAYLSGVPAIPSSGDLDPTRRAQKPNENSSST